MSDTWGWAGTISDFLSTPQATWLQSLEDHHLRLWNANASTSQHKAWIDEHVVITSSLKACLKAATEEVSTWSLVFEYELPMEGGRRPDVVVFTGRSFVVIEFKSSPMVNQGDIDQTIGYVRDLCDYHAGSADLPHFGILVLTGAAPTFAKMVDETPVVGSESLHQYLFSSHHNGNVDLESWLNAPYRPLPTLVEAARRIFRDEPLPHIHTAIAAGIPETVELLGRIVDQTSNESGRSLAFVTGVPGSGKTLVGLRLVHERTSTHGRATFLSGNGPLVQVLQDALSSRVFVRDLHAFIKTYALNQRLSTPEEHIIVFDEAQRAWDARYMKEKKNIERSEPELLISIGERIENWATMVGLIGEGQEIHSGEEAGIQQWRDAVSHSSNTKTWSIHCPPKLKDEFQGLLVNTHEELDLNVTLRSKRAEDLHEWVRLLLDGKLKSAHQQAVKIRYAQYPIYVTRNIDEAKQYARQRFSEEPNHRSGLLASSHAKNLLKHGIDSGYQATSNMNVAKWYNAPTNDPKSSNALIQPVTEFGCQGLELDLPILCWGDDYRRMADDWVLKPINRRYKQDDPHALLRNAYRVLLTRGRDGLIIFVPEDTSMDSTENALLAAGVQLLPSDVELIAV
jgi:DUF2075 family protein